MLEVLKTLPWWAYVFVVVLLVALVWSVGVWYYAGKLETPDYVVVKSTSDYEIRDYEPILVIQTTASGDNSQATNQGFSVLAGYIFGGNQSKESIAMTAPVLDENTSQKIAMTVPVLDQPLNQKIAMTTPVLDQNEGDERVITFTVPKKWTKETLPIPNDDRVKIVEWPAQKKAVKRFMSLSTFGQKARNKAQADLIAALERDGIEYQADATFAFYNPPWTPFFLRRNEVMVTIN